MKGWTSQMYSNRPGFVTVKVLVPLAKRPVSKDLSAAVTVCSAESLFSTVTRSPTLTSRASGANSKFEMVMVRAEPPLGPALSLEPPQAADRTTKTATGKHHDGTGRRRRAAATKLNVGKRSLQASIGGDADGRRRRAIRSGRPRRMTRQPTPVSVHFAATGGRATR